MRMWWKQRFQIVCWLCLLVAMIGTPRGAAYAEDWYDYYVQAQQSLKNRDWRQAINLFQKAIQADPEPARQKQHGFRTVAYYPYLELGLAYLASGNFEAAYQNCQEAKQRGAAPQKLVDGKCLAIVTNIYQKLHKPLPQVSQSRQNEAGPQLSFSSPAPPETAMKKITLQGEAVSNAGIREIKLSVENLGITGTTTFTMSGKTTEGFYVHVPLETGRSTITVTAIDAQNRSASQAFVTVRTAPGSDAPLPTAFPAPQLPVQRSTPLPTYTPPRPTPSPTAIPDMRPTIRLLSKIPKETSAAMLDIEGTVIDDRGIAEVNVQVRQPGKKGLFLDAPTTKREDRFHATVMLDIGQNEIVIEAIDSSGQIATHTLTVMRNASVSEEQTSPKSPTGQSRVSVQRPGDVYAVIIGIGDYKDERIPDLEFTVNDARSLYELLTDPDYGGIPRDHVKLLLDAEATDRNIKREIGSWLSRQAKKEDTVIIYYSGHGAPEFQDTYWVTHNADIDDLYTTALNNNEIYDMLARIESERVITFLDSCYSAATVNRQIKTRSVQTEIPWDKFSGKGRVTISASDGKQLSLELSEYGHGVFTYYLLEGLKGLADLNLDGVVEVDEIWNYVKSQVSDTAKKVGNPQTPVLQGSITAGIPLTFNMAFLRQQEQQEKTVQKQEQLKELLLQKVITITQYNCAYKMLKTGETNIWIDGLLSGQLDPEVFRDSFDCD